MSLSKKLGFIISILFLLVFAGTMYISINTTRTYLEEQMTTHARDTATSLGLSLSHAVKSNDIATMKTMVNSIFDSGYYKDITIRSIAGDVILNKNIPVTIDKVPSWFVEKMPLDVPVGTAVIMDGWSQAAEIEVSSHPGFAYIKLWNTALDTLTWITSAWLMAMFIVLLVLKVTLLPLRRMEQQAFEISNRNYVTVDKIPNTREFRSVVLAMNKMSSAIRLTVEQQIKLTEKMRQEAYQDSVTGLANRRNLNARLQQLLISQDQFMFGALFIIQIPKFKKYNDTKGHESGDELLRDVARQLENYCKEFREPVVARLDGASFAVVVGDLTPDEAELHAGKFCELLAYLQQVNGDDATGNVGVAYYDSRDGNKKSASELLSEADMAMSAAKKKGMNTWHLYEKGKLARDEIYTARKWKEVLEKSIQTNAFVFHGQTVISSQTGIPVQREIYARIMDGSTRVVPANIFMPMIEKWELSVELDMSIINGVMKHMRNRPTESICYSINISPVSIRSRKFVDWLSERILDCGINPERLHFEASESGAIIDMEALRAFIGRVRAAGSSFSLDHFGTGFRSFGYLRDMKLHSIKIDGSFIRDIDSNKENQFFVQSLVEIAHGLDIKVVAESVEKSLELEQLKRLGIDQVQGYVISKPEPLK